MPEIEVERPNKPAQDARSARSVRVLAEAAVLIGLAAALNTIKIFTFPQGGSVTLGAMVPIFLLALRRGPKVGIAAGAIFGIIDLYFEYFVYNPIQFLLDYPLAFGALGLAGFLRQQTAGVRVDEGARGPSILRQSWPVIGVAVGIFGRFVCHFLSGLIFFASYAPTGESPALYSAIYNASYLIPEFVISAFVIFALSKRGLLNVRGT
jgi:thiamine transporter